VRISVALRWSIVAISLLVTSTGCDEGARGLHWQISFASSETGGRAAGIEARILRGNCASTDVVFESGFAPTEAGPQPPVLSPGAYAFAATARGPRCRTIAEGCAPVTLPLPDGSDIETVLIDSPGGTSCAASELCQDGVCVSPVMPDAATDAPDAEADGGCSLDPCRIIASNVTPDAGAATPSVSFSGSGSFDTESCAGAPFSEAGIQAQGDGSQVCVAYTADLDIADGANLRIVGSLPLVILAEGDVSIGGVLDGGARGTNPGPGGGAGGAFGSLAGDGAFGGEQGEEVDAFQDGGGGGGGMCGMGGAGGEGNTAAGGEGGGTHPAGYEATPLTGGSGGGSVARGLPTARWPEGGAGGGAIQITSQRAIRITGTILVTGGGGLGGYHPESPGENYPSAGGGGSGGAVLLEARTVEFAGGGAIRADGGGGGGSTGDGDGAGEDGADGGGDADAAPGGVGGSGPRSANGGEGGGRPGIDGSDGGTSSEIDGNGGGGGGGAGCILIRTLDGSLPPNADRSNPNDPTALWALPVR